MVSRLSITVTEYPFSANSLAIVAMFVSEKLSVIEGIVSVQTHFILKKYKIEGQATRPSQDGKRQLIQA